jgi:hypothetical protein
MVRIGSGERMVSKYELKKVLEVLTQPQMREEFMRSQSFKGVAPLLLNLQQQLVFTGLQEGQWKGHKVHKLTGVWSANITTGIVQQIGGLDRWPAALARKCVLYLDAQSLWPLRVEWRGGPAKGEEQVLLQMEFRDPQFVAADAKPPAEYESKFVFDERNLKVVDETTRITEEWRKVASQSRPGPPGQPTPPMSR